MIWKKAADVKYTDLCKYIDAHIPEIAEEGKSPQVEDTVYNYLWLIVKALAIKKHMFSDFADYDGYAFYSANRLYFALKRNYQNQGKIIKGKQIRPVKSCLNYMKTLLYPMKVEYQNENYKMVIAEEFVSKKFDAFAYKEQMKDNIRYSAETINQFKTYVTESMQNCSLIIDKVLDKTYFAKDSVDYKKLKMSLLLNSIYALKNKKKLDPEPATIILWKLPKTMSSYERVLLKEFYSELKKEIMNCYEAIHIDDDMIDKIISGKEESSYNSYED